MELLDHPPAEADVPNADRFVAGPTVVACASMKLFYAQRSPFVRKVMIAAHELGLADRLDTVALATTPLVADPTLSRDNPLAKIPALVTDEGESVFDSAVIVDYFDSLHGGTKLIPATGLERLRALRHQALADGIVEAAVAIHYERTLRPKELHWQTWLDGQAQKAKQGLDAFEREVELFSPTFDVGQISLAAALGWLELRSVLGDLRPGRPRLFAWYEEVRRRPSVVATEPRL